MIAAFVMPFALSPRLRKILAYLALCAMGMSALAPTASRWLAARARAADMVAICDAHGVGMVPAARLWTPDQGSASHHGGAGDERPLADPDDCCPYCTLNHYSPYVPVAAAAFAPPALRLAARAWGANAPAPALRAWREPHMPGAPPAFLA